MLTLWMFGEESSKNNKSNISCAHGILHINHINHECLNLQKIIMYMLGFEGSTYHLYLCPVISV